MKGIARFESNTSRQGCCRLAGLCLLPLVLLAGCFQPQTRGQVEDEKDQFPDVPLIRDVTEVGNFGPIQVSGVGLVTGLEGTGGGNPPGDLRNLLENELRKMRVANVKQLLDSPNNAMVAVTGLIPAGVRKGELIDIQVVLPPQSRATSLKGGYLEACYLRNYDTKKNLDPSYNKPDAVLQGHILAKAWGPLLVGLDQDGNSGTSLTRGSIWQGGVSFIDRPFFFTLKENWQAARVANAVAQKINAVYQDDTRRRQDLQRLQRLKLLEEVTDQLNEKFHKAMAASSDMARATSPKLVAVNVPWEYRLNTQHYLRVALLIPLSETAQTRPAYRQRLQTLLLDPAQTVRAALRLEALGKESVPALRSGLGSPSPLVRFCAAEALAYLGCTDGIEELARIADEQPLLRAFCLTALASLDEPACRLQLGALLSSVDAETRYGAFRALQLLADSSPQIKGQLLDNTFWLHRVAPQSPPLVHYSLVRRAEVVLFGQEALLVPPFRLLAGKEFTVTATPEDDRCTVSRFHLKAGQVLRKQCSLKLEEILRTLADLEAEYPDVVAFLHQAEEQHCMNCPIAINALPQPMDVEDLAVKGRDPNFLTPVVNSVPATAGGAVGGRNGSPPAEMVTSVRH